MRSVLAVFAVFVLVLGLGAVVLSQTGLPMKAVPPAEGSPLGAADGVATLNQPGAVAAAVLPGGRVVAGMARQDVVALIAPSYRAVSAPLPAAYAARLAPETSIVPYFALDVSRVLTRLAEINGDRLRCCAGCFTPISLT